MSQSPPLTRIVVAIDPAAASGEEAAETGIVVPGIGENGHGYVLDDLSCRASPDQWASRAVLAFHKHRADRILGEVNNGGEMVEHVIRTVDPAVPFRAVHASRGKAARAEPVAALYEQGRVHYIRMFPDLESQMCMYLPSGISPDRMDALVWALTDLMVGRGGLNLDAWDEGMRLADEMFGRVGAVKSRGVRPEMGVEMVPRRPVCGKEIQSPHRRPAEIPFRAGGVSGVVSCYTRQPG